MINVIINGEEHQFPNSLSLTELLQHLKLSSSRVAVELNQAVVRRSLWNETKISHNDKIEIVHFVGGGFDFEL